MLCAPTRPPELNEGEAALCVLASGSRGNCSLLVTRVGGQTRAMLIDAGLSPRLTRRLLGGAGIEPHQLDDIVVTHLDSDHFHSGWVPALSRRVGPLRARLRMHSRHAWSVRQAHPGLECLEAFEDAFEMGGSRVDVTLLPHDELGVAAFRFEFERARSLGYATDLGRPTRELGEALARVGTLALESNYCPELQLASRRPAYLKRRIMGGRGHLSNQQCAELVGWISPASQVVLLHLSQECNTPERAAAPHDGAAYTLTVSSQSHATPWIPIAPGRPRQPKVVCETIPLFAPAVGR
ncbi:MAG: MBL fold metallo-hydrolase [Phycisphaerales bacterium]